MRRLPVVLVAGVLGTALLWAAGGATPAGSAKRCPKGKVTRVADGKRTCLPAARFRVRASPPSATASAVQQALGSTMPLRLKNGSPARRPLPAAVVNGVARTYSAEEAKARTSLRAALAQKATARSHELTATGGTVTRSADGSSATATVGFAGTAGGHTVGGTIEFGANASGRLDVGFDVTVTDPTGATKSTGIKARDILSRNQECPGADGKLPLKGGFDVTSKSGETFGSKRVHLGTVRDAAVDKVTSSATVGFGADGKAQPFTFTVTASHSYNRSAQVLAFFQSRVSATGTGTMTGTIDPATGTISNASLTTNLKSTGYGSDAAKAEASLRSILEKLLNDEVGRLRDAAREAEQKCGKGYDVTLALTTNADFATNSASGTLNATLRLKTTATGPLTYENIAFASKVPECSYIDPKTVAGTWTVTIEKTPADRLKVTWGPGQAGLTTTATIHCVFPQLMGPPIITDTPGQPGPSLLAPAPTTFELPLTGGQQAIAGGVTDAGGGYTHTGTITVTPATR